MDYFNICFTHFSLEELGKIKNFDFKKIVEEAKKVYDALKKCNYCGKKSKYYYHFGCSKYISFSDEYTLIIHYGKFCSYYCFKQFIKEDISEVKFLTWGNQLERQVIMSLQPLLKYKFRQLDKLDLPQEIGRIIQQRKLEQNCDCCHKNKKKIGLSIDAVQKRGVENLAYGKFCSRKCVKKFFKENINKIKFK